MRNNYGALLKGLVQCGSCNAGMIHTYSSKGSRRYRYYVCIRAQQKGWESCETKSVSAPAIESAVVQQIRAIGADPRIVVSALQKVEQQRLSRIGELNAERQVTENELATLGLELRQMVPLVGNCVTARMADLQERIGRAEHRLIEVKDELEGLQAGRVDERDLHAAFVQFGPVWESLNSREQIRIIRRLVDRVTYDGKAGKVSVIFRSEGIREMCQARS